MKHHLIETNSTNAWLMVKVREMRANGEPVPDLLAVYADFQTAGRGAGTNTWHSSRGLNILASVCFDTGLAAADQFVFNLWFATSTRRFLAKYVPEVLIKWPNDMYVHDSKLAGDLTEHSVSGGQLDFTVAGIGINVNEELFPTEIPHPTSLFLETGQHYDIGTLMEEYLGVLRERRPLLDTEHTVKLREEYLSHLYHLNEPHPYIIHGQQITGIIRDIDRYGQLILEHPDGTKHPYEYKQVAYAFSKT
jgi:BirA family biotin operon repressor/biotin-[acetyl-CoA-carboxylase] ligase